jgi:Tol biopolymer transport system component
LEKLPADRFDSAKAFAEALSNPGFTATTVAGSAAAVTSYRRPVASGILAALAVVFFATTLWQGLQPKPQYPVTRALVDLGGIPVQSSGQLLVAPDGSRFAVVGTNGGPIYWRGSEETEFRALAGTENAEYAAFSPDGESLVFALNSGPTLKRVALSGGAPQTVTELGGGYGGLDWGEDGHIVFTGSGGHGIYRIPEGGGEPEQLLDPEQRVRNPKLLPEGNAVIFTNFGAAEPSTEIVDLSSRSVRSLRQGALAATYVDAGYLVYIDESGTLWAARFDAGAGKIVGERFTVFDGVSVLSAGPYARLAISRNGTLVYGTGVTAQATGQQLAVVRLDGALEQIPLSPRRFGDPRWAPDGRTIAYWSLGTSGAGAPFIFTYDVVLGSAPRQLTDSAGLVPVWSPDGRRIAFGRLGPNDLELAIRAVDNDGAPKVVVALPGNEIPLDWPSPDTLVFRRGGDEASWWILDMTADTAVASPYLVSEESVGSLRVAPSGTLAVGEEGGVIYVRSFPVAGARVRISAGDGNNPIWSPDGRTIYYWAPEGDRQVYTLVAAHLSLGPPVSVVRTDTLYTSEGAFAWALHPDGDRFLLSHVADTGSGDAPRERFIVVTNWFEELRRRGER